MYAVQFRVKEEKSVVKVTWNDEEDVDVCKDCCDDLGKNWEVGEWQDNEDCEYAHVGHMVLCKGGREKGRMNRAKREGRGREEGGKLGRREGRRREEEGKEGRKVMKEKGKGKKKESSLH